MDVYYNCTIQSFKMVIFVMNAPLHFAAFEGGGGGGLFNLAKTMVSVLYKELQYRVEKLKYKKLEFMKSRIKNKSELPDGE